jgi:outer membrane lipoprotein-sorting protein
MRSFTRTALGAALLSFAAMGVEASAQSVPLPRPAPKARAAVGLPSVAPPGVPNRSIAPADVKHIAQAPPIPPAAIPPAAAPPAAAAGGKPAAPTRPGGATAFDADKRALIERVNAYLSSMNTLVGNFVQVGPDGGRVEGRFYLQKPGRVRFEYNPPSPIELIADGSSVVVRDRKLATQDVYPLSQTPLRFLVADRIDLLKDTNVVSASADDTFATVVIEEKQTLGGTHRLMLMFGARDFQLRQWTITDPQGYDTTVALYNIDAKQKPDPALFKIDYTRYLQ